MIDFHQYIMRHGEFGVQAIIEGLERFEGIRFRADTTLEERWNALMSLERHSDAIEQIKSEPIRMRA